MLVREISVGFEEIACKMRRNLFSQRSWTHEVRKKMCACVCGTLNNVIEQVSLIVHRLLRDELFLARNIGQ